MAVTIGCEEYSLISVAGPNPNKLPSEIRQGMKQHLKDCDYHQSRQFTSSAAGTPVTPEMENAVQELIEKLGA